MLWLDFMVFGSGNGMQQPFWDGPLYWLVDTGRGDRDGRHGSLYTWIGGFGAQLQSFQWTMPKPQERRTLAGREFRVFSADRYGPRVRVAWATVKDIGEAEDLRKLERQIHEGMQ